MNELIFIGLGLNDSNDISCKGLEELKIADSIFAEFYTAKMANETVKNLERTINKKIRVMSRTEVEDSEIIIQEAKHLRVVFLCQGDPFTATTHIDLLLRAKEQNITTRVIHSSSVVTAVPGLLGLQFYKFGRTTTIAFPEGEYFPESPFDVISENLKRGLHTLVLLDINSNENKYMTANDGIELLLKINSKRKESLITHDTLLCVVARAGSEMPIVCANFAGELLKLDFGKPLHTIVVPGKLHFKEAEALEVLGKAPKKCLKNNMDL